ncbi:aKG-HExxH-type peptide beta-hydroxylase [Lentzea xinjiangensis]|uniref:aKG-HExxH-type peptide beta-hydroxylase n=1 Tax=Lentzea xinjiangensis TaxID=402600 RepID=UPI000B7F6AD4|nr:HEXXH motif-containing putative peptide modification protein [Lentzea xinjiangensis]
MSTHALHAAIAPAAALVEERRTLYRLAADLFTPGTELSDNLADHPIVRYEIGRALAGHDGPDWARLARASAMRVRDAGIAVVADPAAAELLEAPLRIVAPPGTRPQPLTEADGERFDLVCSIVAEGVRLFRALAPRMAEDLLAHVSMLAVLKKETSGGVVSASSRYVPGIVLIDEPSLPMEVAEALVHEGAHEKFFDLAITREFLDAAAEEEDCFVNSWSRARWPLEQTFAAWHAYSCLAQFHTTIGAHQPGPDSLLPKARERADEIGRWLIEHETALRADSRWLLRSLFGEAAGELAGERTAQVDVRSDVDYVTLCAEIREDGNFRVVPDVRIRRAGTGRAVVGRATRPPDLFWLDTDASWVAGQLDDVHPTSFGSLLSRASEEWHEPPDLAVRRLRASIRSLESSAIIESTP